MRQRAGVVPVIHDTTEADFSGLSAEGLGQIGNGWGRGFLPRNALAVDFDQREVLGLVGEFPHVRRKVRRKEGLAASRAHPQRESRLWVKGVEAVGAPGPGGRWVNPSASSGQALMDRGGDTFESLDRQQRLGQSFVVRSRTNRNVRVKDKAGRMIRRKLHDWARGLPPLGPTRDRGGGEPQPTAAHGRRAGVGRAGGTAGAHPQIWRARPRPAGGVGGARVGARPAGRPGAAGMGPATRLGSSKSDQRAGDDAPRGLGARGLVLVPADRGRISQGGQDGLRDGIDAVRHPQSARGEYRDPTRGSDPTAAAEGPGPPRRRAAGGAGGGPGIRRSREPVAIRE